MKTKTNKKHITRDYDGNENGYLVPIWNIHENFAEHSPQQVYLSVVTPGRIKGPHLHNIRHGYFTCIKGNIRVILKTENGYETCFSGEDYEYTSVIVPAGTPAVVQCLGDEDALILNMPSPAWTPDMNDEHTADFSDFDFTL
jgi:dTDP-4-dehydrorhamnose 3,5-epimerase-like enzyme